MSEKPPKPEQNPWSGADFVLLLFLPAADIASIYGDQAKTLGIPCAELAQNAHLLMLACCFAIPLVLSHGPLARWRHGITVGAVFLCMLFPVGLLSQGSISIPLSRPMSSEEYTALRSTFGIPAVLSSDSKDGDRLRLRRSDYSEAVKSYVTSIGGAAAEAPPAR